MTPQPVKNIVSGEIWPGNKTLETLVCGHRDSSNTS
ncbi:hypothetical protein MICRO80W_270056 [Micrococcus luteus]|nr:hypothetical protein MICRO80W_270056 [Micrococcus luteus]